MHYVRNISGDSFQIVDTSGATNYLTQNTSRNDIYFSLIVPGIADEFDNIFPYTGFANNPWGDPQFECSGLDTTGTDLTKVWVDTTTGGCNGSLCVYKDRIANLEWTKLLGNGYWAPSIAACDGLVYDGKSDWRMPSVYEWAAASLHGLASLGNANWISTADMNTDFMTSTMNATDDVSNVTYRPSDGNKAVAWKNSAALNYVCVRP